MTGRPDSRPPICTYDGGPRPGTVMTIHNIAFQGIFPADLLHRARLPPGAFTLDGVEYYGQIGFLKAGLQLADRITTVSPTYAKEIQTPEGGMGLHGLLRTRSADIARHYQRHRRRRSGIPPPDSHLAAPFDRDRLEERAGNKGALQRRLGLKPDPNAMLFGVVSRLSEQKGLDLVLAASLAPAGGRSAAGPARRRRHSAREQLSGPHPASIPGRSAASSAMTNRWRIRSKAEATRCSSPPGSSPAA